MVSARRRGGQAGNVNALKHGLYSRHFQAVEDVDLEALVQEGLRDEIGLMRVLIGRVMRLAATDSLETATNVLGSLGVAATRLAGLMRSQKLLGGDTGGVAAALESAVLDLREEFACQK